MPHQCTDCGRTFEDGSKEMLSGCPDCGGNKFQFIPADAVDESVEANSPGEPPNRGSSAGAVSKAATTVRDWVGGGSDDAERPSSDRPSAGDRPAGDRPSGEWPKSATEDYDTPAEKAAARSDDEGAASADASATADGPPTTSDAQSEAASTTHTDPASDDGSIQARTAGDEDTAQASARSDVVTPDELPDGTATPPDTPADDPVASGRASGRDTPDRDAAGGRNTPAGGRGVPAESESPDVPTSTADATENRHEVADPADTQIDDRPDLDELREELNQQFESIKILNPGQYELNLMELYDREEYIISLREDGRYVIDVPDSWRGDD